jgi:hypothetical protein
MRVAMSGISGIFASSTGRDREKGRFSEGRPGLPRPGGTESAEVAQSAWVRGAASNAESLAKKT